MEEARARAASERLVLAASRNRCGCHLRCVVESAEKKMSPSLITHEGTPEAGNRRLSPRQKLAGCVLVFFEDDNWGKLVNIGPGGMAIEYSQAPSAEHESKFVIESVELDATTEIQTDVRVVWTDERHKTAGVKFVNLAETAQRQISKWLSLSSSSLVEDLPRVQRKRDPREIAASLTQAKLREIFDTPLETPDHLTSTIDRPHADANASHLEKVSPVELVARETFPVNEKPGESVSQSAPLPASLSEALVRDWLRTRADIDLADVVRSDESPAKPAATLELDPAKPGATLELETAQNPGTSFQTAELIADTNREASSGDSIAEASAENIAESKLIDVDVTPHDLVVPGDAVLESSEAKVLASAKEDTVGFEQSVTREPETRLVSGVQPESVTAVPAMGPTADLPKPEPVEPASLELAWTALDPPARELDEGVPSDSKSSPSATGMPRAPESLEPRELATPFATKLELELLAAAASLRPNTKALSQRSVTRALSDAPPKIEPPVISEPYAETAAPTLESQIQVASVPWTVAGESAPDVAVNMASQKDSIASSTPASDFSPEQPAEPFALTPRSLANFDRVTLLCMIGCFALFVFLGLGIMLSHANRRAAVAIVENIRKPLVAKAPASQAELAAPLESFQVEVIDIQNRHWLLNFENSPVSSAPGFTPSPAPLATDKNLKALRAGVPANPKSEGSSRSGVPKVFLDPGNAPKGSLAVPPDSLASGGVPTSNNDTSRQAAGGRDNLVADGTKQIVSIPHPEPAEPSKLAAEEPAALPSTAIAPARPSGSGPVQPALLISSSPPVYPSSARASRIQGDVVVDAQVDETGRVTNMKVISGPTILRQAALESLRSWKYEPARLQGRPVPAPIRVSIKFHLK